jgi:hypothetical protein
MELEFSPRRQHLDCRSGGAEAVKSTSHAVRSHYTFIICPSRSRDFYRPPLVHVFNDVLLVISQSPACQSYGGV